MTPPGWVAYYRCQSGTTVLENKPRILVVDDDRAFSDALVDAISTIGYAATAESNPARVLALVADNSFEVALLDLVMPTINGTDLAAKIALISPDTRIIILTGHADLRSAIDSVQQGINDYLSKGETDIPRLRRALQQAVDRSLLARENRDLVRRLHESNTLLEALNQVSSVLATDTDAKRLLEHLAAAAREFCKAEASRVVLLTPTHAEGLFIGHAAGDGADIIQGVRLHAGEGIVAQVARSGAAVIADDPRSHPAFCEKCDQLKTSRTGFACVPLRNGLAYGALIVAGGHFRPTFAGESARLLVQMASHAAVALDNALQHERAVNFFTHTSEMLVTLLDGVDISYSGHSRRVAALTDMMTRRMGLTDAERRHIHFGALLHDVGKIRVGLDILSSATFLTETQRTAVRQHPALGVEILHPITLWEEILPIVHSHHERWDGRGYPTGLKSDAIPLGARVVAVAEVFDALLCGVPVYPGRTPEQAIQEIELQAGKQFDPHICHLFVSEYRAHGEDAVPQYRRKT